MRRSIILSLIILSMTLTLLPAVGGVSPENTDCYSCHSPAYPISGYEYSPPTVSLGVSPLAERGKEFPVEVGVNFIDYEIKELVIGITQDPEIFDLDNTVIRARDLNRGRSFNFTARATENGASEITITVNATIRFEHATLKGYDLRKERVKKTRIIAVGSTTLSPSSWTIILGGGGGSLGLTAVENVTDLNIFSSPALEAEPSARSHLSPGSELTVSLRPLTRKRIDENLIISWRANGTPYAVPVSVIYDPPASPETDLFHWTGRVAGISTLILLAASILLGGIWNTAGYLNRIIGAGQRLRYHCAVSWFLFGSALYHGAVLLVGPYAEEFGNGWILLGYLNALLLLVTSLTGSFKGYTVKLIGVGKWRAVHLYTAWFSLILGIVHGTGIGTDLAFLRDRVDIVAWASVVLGLSLTGVVVLSLYFHYRRKRLARIQGHSGSPELSEDRGDVAWLEDDPFHDDHPRERGRARRYPGSRKRRRAYRPRRSRRTGEPERFGGFPGGAGRARRRYSPSPMVGGRWDMFEYCGSCGKRKEEDALYCPHCGAGKGGRV